MAWSPRASSGASAVNGRPFWLVTVFAAQIFVHNRLPRSARRRLLRDPHQATDHVLEGFPYRLRDQLVLAWKMLVEAPVSETCIPHHSRDCGTIEAVGANAPGGILYNFLVSFCFVLWSITHGITIG